MRRRRSVVSWVRRGSRVAPGRGRAPRVAPPRGRASRVAPPVRLALLVALGCVAFIPAACAGHPASGPALATPPGTTTSTGAATSAGASSTGTSSTGTSSPDPSISTGATTSAGTTSASARATTRSARAAAARWTIALYVNGDNDLSYAWPRFTLPALKGIPANAAVDVVAMVDMPRRDGARLYRISGAEVHTVRYFRRERDFGSGDTFRWFLEQVHARFPSEHLVVVGWDHGYGWHYFSKDDTSGDRILLPELRAAIVDAGVHIDILGFDACNMADVQVAGELASTGVVDRLVASEETIDQDGYPYDDMFTRLADDPAREPDEVVADMLAGWTRYYASRRNFNWVSLSGVDLARVAAMEHDLAAWTTRLGADLPLFAARYQTAMYDTIYAWDSWQLDLGGFAAHLAADPQITDAALRAASAAVRDDVAAAVTAVTSGSYSRGFTGLTVWAGTGFDWKDYRRAYRAQVAFGRPVAEGGTGWYAFLHAFNADPAADRHEPDPLVLPGRATYGLSDVYVRDAGHGWATGFDNLANTSVVLRSFDAAASWKTAHLGRLGNYLFTAVAPASGGTLWAVGDAGYGDAVIVRSDDGGRTWSARRSTTVDTLFGVDFTSATDGWVCGARGTLLRSTDAGRSWTKVAGALPGDLMALDFADARHGWVAVDDERYPSARLEHTSDAGRTWATAVTASRTLLYGVDAVSDAEVWAVGGDPAVESGTIVHGSANGPWATQWNGDERLAGVAMTDPTHGWAVGDGGTILRTEDGATWTPQASGVTFDLTAVTALDAETAYVVGDGEAILSTHDGGATWRATGGDVLGPETFAPHAARARTGGTARLRYRVEDESGTARPTVRIEDAHGRVVMIHRSGWVDSGEEQVWTFRCALTPGRYTFHVFAVDEAGNHQDNVAFNTLEVTGRSGTRR